MDVLNLLFIIGVGLFFVVWLLMVVKRSRNHKINSSEKEQQFIQSVHEEIRKKETK